MADHDDRERRLVVQAGQCHGIITRRQALAAGLTPNQIAYRLNRGMWEGLGKGVYRVAGSTDSEDQRLAAAVCSAPLEACVSHGSAAWLHGWGRPPDRHELIVPPGVLVRSPVALTHRAPLYQGDVVHVAGFRCTSPARTIVDCASFLSISALVAMVDQAIIGRLTTPARIAGTSAAVGRHRGRVNLAAALQNWAGEIRHDSVQEAYLFRAIRDWGLPLPVPQFQVLDIDGSKVARLDVAWPGLRRMVEYNGELFHGPGRVAADQTRHDRLVRLGWDGIGVECGDLRPRSGLRGRIERLLASAPEYRVRRAS